MKRCWRARWPHKNGSRFRVACELTFGTQNTPMFQFLREGSTCRYIYLTLSLPRTSQACRWNLHHSYRGRAGPSELKSGNTSSVAPHIRWFGFTACVFAMLHGRWHDRAAGFCTDNMLSKMMSCRGSDENSRSQPYIVRIQILSCSYHGLSLATASTFRQLLNVKWQQGDASCAQTDPQLIGRDATERKPRPGATTSALCSTLCLPLKCTL